MKKTVDATVKNPPLPRQYGEELTVFDHGRGCFLFDRAGRQYLDMGSGISVNSLGYGLDDLANIAAQQMRKLIHVSNLFATEPQLLLAEKIIAARVRDYPFFEAVHFGNSGTEANETAIKYARLYARTRRGEGHHRLISFSGSFHGRSMGSLSLTANPAYREPFEPLIPGVEILPLNDTGALEARVNPTVAGIIVEPLQGEGGLNALRRDFVQALNTLCRKHDIMLIADEVQTGLGRCGALFASDLIGLEPDMVTLAKPLAAGLPLSAVLTPSGVNAILRPGHHATTFGGGPVTTAVALEVWDRLAKPDFLDEVRRKGDYLASLMEEHLQSLSLDGEVRGMGLLRGFRLKDGKYDGPWCSRIIAEAQSAGLIILKSGKDVLRLAPPLVISREEIDEGVAILFKVIKKNINQGVEKQ